MARDRSLDIAVSGMAGRFPGSPELTQWWDALTAGRVLTRRYQRQELAAEGVPPDLLDDPDYVAVHGHLADADRFDHLLFRMSPREAEMLDPQHRLMLECAWSALEDAGANPLDTGLTTGVFASASSSDYLRRMVAGGQLTPLTLEDALHGTEPDFLASLLSYRLNLNGPALAVQTACSSSLVAVHLAVQALLNGDCDQALVVAAGMAFPQAGHLHVPGGIHSPTGHCRPFDASADGIVAGSGVACVVLRRLADALDDGPAPHGIILGTAINNDGSAKAGFYAPSVEGQQAVIRAALRAAEVGGESIGYLESHGTGTRIGDPIEWAAASAALRASGARPGQVAVGALKANTGHLDNAAGVAGLIKAIMVVREGLIPPVAGHTTLNPLLERDGSPLYVPEQVRPWPGTEPRRAGVSSFGVGGTNAHVVVEQPPVESTAPRSARPGRHLVVLSAADGAALDRAATRLAAHLRTHDVLSQDVVRTLATGRAHLAERLAVVGTDTDELAERLASRGTTVHGRVPATGPAPLVFAFPGQGAQYPGMARPLAADLPGFSAALATVLDEYDPTTAELVGRALLDSGFPADDLAETALAQPALFAVEYAAAMALRELGLHPAAVTGHSLGEITAAGVAGVLDLADAARLVTVRGAAMQQCPPGAMLALTCGEQETADLVRASGLALETAAVNSPDHTVVAGPPDVVDAFEAWLSGRVRTRRLRSRRAFHTALVDAADAPLREALAGMRLRPPTLPWATNSGELLLPGAPVGAALFTAQARHTVRFGPSLRRLGDRLTDAVVVEVGPGHALSTLAESGGLTAVPLCGGRPGADDEAVPTALGRLWTIGQPVAIDATCPTGRRVHLPGYAFHGPRHLAAEARPAPAGHNPSGVVPLPVNAPAPAATAFATGPDSGIGATPGADHPAGVFEQDVPSLLGRLWSDLLGRDQLSDDADFFALGGDSLSITHLARRLRTELGIRVPIRDLMTRPTLGDHTSMCRALVDSVRAPVAVG
ncbi:type I polyketide synthase [Micromonospora zamorensis]|uniref:type I polyketide synthase n=1 Tax=Micromonospora zamorensis TaxID=709883 RepID=UPI0036822AB0